MNAPTAETEVREPSGVDRAQVVDTAPMDIASADWSLWSVATRLVVTGPGHLAAARRIVDERLDAVELAVSRFRDDSELSAVNRAPGEHTVSPVFADLLRCALEAARRSDGAVDPTLGAVLASVGYDRDIDAVKAGSALPGPPVGHGGFGALTIRRSATWRDLRLVGDELYLPQGLALDLGATAKARAADLCAADVADLLGIGVLVSLGGDIATAGPAPDGGWQIEVNDGDGEPTTQIGLPAGSAIATSSTLHRAWQRGEFRIHHIIDPLTLAPAEPVWRTVSVAAPDCVTANTLTTAAMVWGEQAPARLRDHGVPARLVDAGGRVTRLGGWPADPVG